MGFPNQWTRFDDLQVKYNTTESTNQKDYLGIIGSEIPHKELCNFTDLAGVTTSNSNDVGQVSYDLNGGGGINRGNSYKEPRNYCIGRTQVEVIFSTPQDLTALYTDTNNYATITHGINGTDDEKSMYLVLNFKHTTTVPSNLIIEIYSNNYTYASLNQSFQPYLDGSNNCSWTKMQFKLDETTFNFVNGFTLADFKKVTKIKIYPTDQMYYDGTIYFQNLYIALPKILGDNIGAGTQGDVYTAYYPNTTNSNSIFVSQVMGNDYNDGLTRETPVQTLFKAWFLFSDGGKNYIVILDSDTYKQNLTPFSSCDTVIIADYLESPTISMVSGVSNSTTIGARVDYRYKLTENDATFAGNTIRVLKSGYGDFDNINEALSYATDGDCIEICDNGIYEEYLNTSKNITIQAKAGFTPIIKMPTGAPTHIVINITSEVFTVNFYGITFVGNGDANTVGVYVVGTTLTQGKGLSLYDCTFTNYGSNLTGSSQIFSIGWALETYIDLTNCLFTNNGQYVTVLLQQRTVPCNVIFTNCSVRSGLLSDGIFIANQGGGSSIIVNCCEVVSPYTQTASKFCYYSNGYVYPITFDVYDNLIVSFTKTNNYITIDQAYHLTMGLYLKNNYFYTENNYNLENDVSLIAIYTEFQEVGTAYGVYYIQDNVFVGDKNNPNEVRAIFFKARRHEYIATTINISNNTFCNFKLQVLLYCEHDGANFFHSATIQNNIHKNAESVAYYIHLTFLTVTGCIFDGGNFYAFSDVPSVDTLTFTNCINNTISGVGGTGFVLTNILNANPLFLDSYGANNGYLPNSPIETYGEIYSQFFNFDETGIVNQTYNLRFFYLNFEGQGGKSILRNISGEASFCFCNIYGNAIGIDLRNDNIFVDACKIYNNGIGIRVAQTVTTSEGMPKTSLLRYNIVTDNGTGVELIKGCDIWFNTLQDNGYGIYSNLVLSYGVSYMSNFVTVLYNIISFNKNYDYYCEVKTNYNLIGSRYFDELPITNTNKLSTIGVNDLTGSSKLTPNYYPQTIYNGYDENSPVFCYSPITTGGDKFPSSMANATNIGARFYNYISATISGDNFTFSPLSQPYAYKRSVESINLVENNTVAGKYSSYQDISRVEVVYGFGSAGEVGKLDETELNVFKYVYDTFWIVGVRRFSSGAWTYYKVKRSQKLSYSTQWTLYDNMPSGDLTIALIPMPNNFNLDDYTAEIGI